MIRRFLIALSLLGVSVASATETPAPEPSPTFGTGLYCISVAQSTNDECGWEFEEGRYVDPRWINACAPECAGVNSRVQNQDRCEWKLLYDGATATPMFFNPTATPTVTPPPTSTNCGQAVHLDDWVVTGRSWCNAVLAHKTSLGWTNCIGNSSAYRVVGIDIRLEFGEDNLQDISNFDFSWLGWQDANGTVTFERCRAGRPCPDNQYRLSVSWVNGQFANTEFPPLVEGVYSISIGIGGQPGTVANIPVDDARDYIVLNDIRFCASDAIFTPETTTPTPTPTMTPTPTPEPDCARTGKGIHMDGVANADCQLNYPSPWDEFSNEFYNNPSDTNCQGAYYFGGRLPALYEDVHDTIWFSGVTYSALCAPGIVYTFYVSETSYYQRVCPSQSQGWTEITHQIQPVPQINNPIFQVGISKLSDPSVTVYGAIDNLWIGYYDKPPCIDSGIQCHEPLYLDEMPALFEWFSVVKTIETCYILIPELSGSVADALDISYDGLSVCFELYKFDDIKFFGVVVDVMMFLRVAMIGFVLRNIMTR